MGRIRDFVTGADLMPNGNESRTLAPGRTQEAFTPVSRTALPPVSETTAMKIADVFSAVKVLADGLSSLPIHVYRSLPSGSRVPAGEDQRLVQLLSRPSPGTTSADLVSQIVVDLSVSGNAFVGKFRAEGSIVQLACLPPDQVVVEQKAGRVVYTLSRPEGISEHGPEDIVHIRGLSSDGVRGLSPVRQAAKVLQLDEGLVSYAANFLGNAARPGGILAVTGDAPLTSQHAGDLKDDWQELFTAQGPGAGAGKIAVLSGDDLNFERVEPAMKDSEFLAQRELAAREVARIFNLPPWVLGVSSGDSLTYSTVAQQNRYLVDHTLRPLAVKIERAISGDSDLAPGSTYARFNFDALLRGDTRERFDAYKTAIEAGVMTVDECRALEDMPPIGGSSND